MSYLFLGQVVREVSDHNLILGGNAVLGRSTLLLLTGSTCLGLLGSFGSFSTLFGVNGLASGVGEREGRSWFIGGSLSISLLALMKPVVSSFSSTQQTRWPYTASATSATTTSTSTTTTTTRASTPSAFTSADAFSTACSSFSLLLSSLGLASKLD